jgi:hypothetical protein
MHPAGHDPHDDHLARLQRRLTAVSRRLEGKARPVRDRLEALGTAGLFALAAQEELRAERAEGPRRTAHHAAAQAAERLAEQRLGHPAG